MRGHSKRMLYLIWIFIVIFLFGSNAQSNSGSQSKQEVTIKWIARTLNRLGEPALANKLWTDFRNGRIRFVEPKVLEGDNAAVDHDSKGNFMELNNELLRIADYEKLLGKNPYGKQSILVIAAGTVVHEYVHMGQVRPELTPKFEDPAWQNSDRTYLRWFRRLRDELEAAKKLQVSAERTRKVSELVDLLQRLGESAGADAAELPKKFGDTLSKGQKWNLLSGLPQLILKTATDGADWLAKSAKAAPTTTAVKIPKGGAWVLRGPEAFSPEPRSDYDHLGFKFSISPGTISGSWHRGDNPSIRTSLKMTWTTPPTIIEPGKQFSITFSPSDNGSSPGAWGFLSAATALYFIPKEKDAWQFLSQARPAYAEFGQAMNPHVAAYTAPQGKPGNLLALQVNTGTSLLGGWGYNYFYEYKSGP